jgi:glyoxylase-like metal-dependent hydrolase (beta-lactamase superfamily II)
MLKIKKFVFNPFYENTYIVYDETTKESAIIDPGCYDESEEDEIESFISVNQLKLIFMINTHCHIDHIYGNAFIKKKYQATYLAPEKDIFLLDLMIEQAKSYQTELVPSPKPDKLIIDNQEIIIGKSIGQFIFTPGRSPGGHCIYFKKEKICFSGDVLFKNSIGRTDLWQGSYDELIDSIENKLFVLHDDVIIYPGHEDSSTIGEEKKRNPFFN